MAVKFSIKFKILLILFLLFLWANPSWALWSFKYDWIQINSENFVVLADKEYKEYGLLVSKKAEEAFTALQAFSEQHPKKTYIIIDHTKNFSNGSATFFPYALINIQPNPPSPFKSVGQYDDWLYELLVHEYTHILSFHNRRGFYRPLRWMLGTTVSPGYFMPLWYLEGLAVNTESFLSDGGRLRSARYQSFSKKLYETNIAYANEQQTGTYPFGATPYIYGGWINYYAAMNSKRYDDPIKALGSVHNTFSQRVPYFIDTGFYASHKVGAYKSFKETFTKNRPKSTHSRPAIGEFPQWSKAHNALFYLREDPFSRDRIYKLEGNKETLVLNYLEIEFYKVTKDYLYFVTSDIEKQDHQVFNLRSFNFKTKKIKKLTKGLNIHNFDISGDKLVFVRKHINKQELVITKLSDPVKNQETVFLTTGQDRLALPKFINSNLIAFAHKKAGESETLKTIDLSTLNKKTLFTVKHINFISAYKNQLFFLYEEDGNRFLNRGDQKQIIPVDQGLLTFDIKSENEIHLVPYSSKKFTSNIASEGPYITKSNISDLKANTNAVKLPNYRKPTLANNKTKITDYNSFFKLAPHYVMPMFEVSPYGFSGDFLLGLSTGSQDPLGLNSYTFSVFTDTVTEKLSASFDYTSSHYRMPLSFSFSQLNTPLSLELTRTSTNASFATSYTFNSNIGESFRMSTGVLWSEVVDNDRNSDELLRAGPYLSFDLQDAQSQTRELAPRKGYRLNLFGHYFAPVTDDYFDYFNLRFGARAFFKSPIVSSHRFVFGLDGQWNDRTLPPILAPNNLNQLYRNAGMGDFTLRGAPTGGFFADDWFASAHLEYRFPIIDINWGPGLLPGFFSRITGAITSDYAVVQGIDAINRVFIDEDTQLYSAGAEMVFEGTAFYHIPASLQIGVYKFLNTEVYDDDPTVFVGFGLTGF